MTDAAANSSERPSLKQRVFAASAWSLGGYGLSLAIRFGSNLIMTRLLMPEMFGVMAIAWVIMAGLAMFSDLGLNQNIVQSHRGNDPAFLNTAWSVQIVRGFVLLGCALGASLSIFLVARYGLMPPDSVYADPSLPGVVAAVSFSAALSGFASTKIAEARRSLALSRVTQLEIATQLAGLACMLIWAAIDRSIWVLVGGALFASFVSVVLSHVWLPGNNNRWHWDPGAFAEIFHFGKWIFASSILGFLVSNGDRLLLGGMIDSSTLGLYAIAFLLFSTIELVMIRVIGAVGFPALSEVVRAGRDIKAAYYRFHSVIAPLAYFCAGALMVSGPMIVNVLYDARYEQAGWMLQVLAATLLMAPFNISVQAYLALGRPHIYSRVLMLRLLALCIAMPIGFFLYGLPGALVGFALSYFASLPAFIVVNYSIGVLDWKRELQFLPVLLVGVISGKLAIYAIMWLIAR